MSKISSSIVSKRLFGDIIELICLRPPGFMFTPGQFVDIYSKEDRDMCRPYSIASGTNQDCITFLIKRLENGKLTNEIFNDWTNGDTIQFSEPMGFFTVGQTNKKIVCISTGTGIAPFISYMKSIESDTTELGTNFDKCIAGFRYVDEVMISNPQVQLCITADDCPDEWSNVHKGRVTQYLEENQVDTKCMYYLCGVDEMLSDVTDLLVSKDVPVENIMLEVFYFK